MLILSQELQKATTALDKEVRGTHIGCVRGKVSSREAQRLSHGPHPLKHATLCQSSASPYLCPFTVVAVAATDAHLQVKFICAEFLITATASEGFPTPTLLEQ